MSHRDFPLEEANPAKKSTGFSLMTLNGKTIGPEELQQQQAQKDAQWRRIVEAILLKDETRSRLPSR